MWNDLVSRRLQRIITLFFTLHLLFLASGCRFIPSQDDANDTPDLTQNAAFDVDYYLKKIDKSEAVSQKIAWRLLAIESLLNVKAKKAENAQTNQQILLQQIEAIPNLSIIEGPQLDKLLYLIEQLDQRKNLSSAQKLSSHINIDKLSPAQKIRFYKNKLLYSEDRLEKIRLYIEITSLITDITEKEEYLKSTLDLLLQFSSVDLELLVIQADETILQGWLDLLFIYNENKNKSVTHLRDAINRWKQSYSQHPAQALALIDFFTATNTNQQANKVALLLPISPPYQQQSNAIYQGFLTLPKLQAKAAQTSPTTQENNLQQTALELADIYNPFVLDDDINNSSQLKIYDTTNKDIEAIIEKTQQDQIKVIVGPLLKKAVNALFALPEIGDSKIVPETQKSKAFLFSKNHFFLTLNTPEKKQQYSNLQYFGLAPEDEAKSSAKRISQLQLKQPLLLAPVGIFGDRMIKAFTQTWFTQNPTLPLLIQRFGTLTELKKRVVDNQPLILTAEKISSINFSSTSISGTEKTVDEPIDSIYIITAELDSLLALKQLLTITEHSNLPIFTNSASHNQKTAQIYGFDLENIQFSEIPFFNPLKYQSLLTYTAQAFSGNYALMRLYAMGIDAYLLQDYFVKHLAKKEDKKAIKIGQISGLSGNLQIDENGVISRELIWFKYQNGKVVLAKNNEMNLLERINLDTE